MLKKIISGIAAVALLGSVCCISPIVSHAASKTWNFSADNEGWAANKGTLSVSNGVMTHTVAAGNNNAFLMSPNNLNIDGSEYKSIKIRLKNNNVKSGAIVVSFITTSDSAWDTSYSTGTKTVITSTGITGYDSEYKEYAIDMSGNSKWTNGIVTRFRLLTALNSTSIPAGSMDIDYIRVTSADRDPLTYYVSSNAPAGGDGSAAAPWNELADLDTADIQPGDTILLKRGSVFNESFAPTAAGSSDDWITLAAYGRGARPVIAPGTNAASRAAIMLDDVYGWKLMNLEIKNARIGIEMRNSTLNTFTPDGLWIEDCFIHDISGIASPQSLSDMDAGSTYLNNVEANGVYMSYGILLYKELGRGNKSFNNVTIKNCFVTETDEPLFISYANNSAIEDCVFANSRKAGVLLSNMSDKSVDATQPSHMTGCKVYNMGYNGGMYWGVAGVQFNTCNYFTMSDCDVFYTQIGGYDETLYPGKVPDGVAVDFEGANNYVTVENCNLIGNMDSGFLWGQNATWAPESPNVNMAVTNNYIANNRLRTYGAKTRNGALMHMSYLSQSSNSGTISGNTILKRNGQKLLWYAIGDADNNTNYLTNDLSYLSDNYDITIGSNNVSETASTASITVAAAGAPSSGSEFNVNLSSSAAINAASTELYVNTDLYGTYSGMPASVGVTTQSGGNHMLMAKVTLTNGDVIYSSPIRVNVAGDIIMPEQVEEESIKYDWNFDIPENVDAWVMSAAKGTLTQNDGCGVMDIAAYNATVMCPVNLEFSGEDYPYLHIIMKNETGTANRQKIQWLTTDDGKWDNSAKYIDKTWTDVEEDADGFVHYIYDMSDNSEWSGKRVNRFQINPAANATSGEVYIDRIAVSSSEELPNADSVVIDGVDSLSAYAQPFWTSELMINESVTMINGADGSPAQAPLLYTPTSIVSVRNSALDEEYFEGVDYTIEGNVIKLTANSSVKAYDYTDVYPETAITDSRKGVSGGYVYCPEGDFFHNGQLAVTYYHEKDNSFPATEGQGDLMPLLQEKLAAKDDVNVLLYGDSISAGANMSGRIGARPWLPMYGEFFCRALSEKTGANVKFTNISKSGQTSEWGAENASALIADKDPDVLIIAFGMNDGTFGNTIAQFKENIESIITTANTLYPDCEVILVSTTIPNENVYRADGTSLFIGNHRSQPAALEEIANAQGIPFVNMTDLHDALLGEKRFVDMTGNNTNHPNDFLARCYVMSLMQAVTVPEYNEELAARWSFTDDTLGWASNKGTKTGSKPLYTDNGTLEYYLSDNSAEGANTNNFILSPANLGIDGGKYKYVKIRLRSELPVAGDLGVQFTTAANTAFPSVWTGTAQTVLKAGAVTGNDTSFKEYIVDMSKLPAWTEGTISRLRIRVNPAEITAGNSGLVHIASVAVSDCKKATPVKNNVKYDWDFENTGSVDNWLISAAKGTLTQSNGNAVVDFTASNGAVMCPANIEFSGTEYPYIHLVSKNDTGAANYQKIQWLTSDDTIWNSDTMYLTKTWSDAEGYVHYVYDMSENPCWKDKTITRFSIYPAAGAASGKVYIDRIMISGIPAILYEDNSVTFSNDIASFVSCRAAVRQSESGTAKLIIAQYANGGVLKSVKFKDITFESNIQSAAEESAAIDNNAAYAKAFVWTGFNDAKPICESEIKYFGAGISAQ